MILCSCLINASIYSQTIPVPAQDEIMNGLGKSFVSDEHEDGSGSAEFDKHNKWLKSYTLMKLQQGDSDDDSMQFNSDFSNHSSNRKWFKKHVNSNPKTKTKATSISSSDHGSDSFRWASPSQDGNISESSICASSEMLQEHLVLLDLESVTITKDAKTSVITAPLPSAHFPLNDHATSSPRVRPDVHQQDSGLADVSGVDDDHSIQHLSNGITDLAAQVPSLVSRMDDVLDPTDSAFDYCSRPTMPYFPSDIIQRLSPVFNDTDDDVGKSAADLSPDYKKHPSSSPDLANMTTGNNLYMYYFGGATSRAEWNHESVDSLGVYTNIAACPEKEPLIEEQKISDDSKVSSHEQKLDNSMKKTGYYQLTNVDDELCADTSLMPGHCDLGSLVSDRLEHSPYHEFTDLPTDLPTKPTLTLEQLPEELIFKILSYLSLHDLCLGVAPLSRKWRDYANHPILWQFVDLSDYPNMHWSPDQSLDLLLKRVYLLKSLSLRGWSDLTVSMIELIGHHCTMLQDINIGFCDNLNENILEAIVSNCKLLTVVNIEGCECINDKAAFQFTFLPELRVLNMSHCTKITDVVILNIARLCRKLEALNIDGIPWISDR